MAGRPLLHRLHNPKNYECGCDRDCWCRRTRVGRLVKWWFPARWFGIRHKNSFFDDMSWDEIRAWKREQQRRGPYPMVAQPKALALWEQHGRKYVIWKSRDGRLSATRVLRLNDVNLS